MKTQGTQKLFFQQFRENFFEVGAVLPSSQALARAMTAYLAQKQGPVSVLEVGAGSGAFTRVIMPLLEPGDMFDIVEINPRLITALQQSFQREPCYQNEGVQVRFLNEDIRKAPLEAAYDYIVFSLPLTNFPAAMTQEILQRMVERLKPGGVFTYVRYIFLSRLKYLFGSANVRRELDANRAVIRSFTKDYQIGRSPVLWNVPPAWTFYWQKQT